MACMIKYLLASGIVILGSSSVIAHSWYPASCCSDKDCHALIEENGETVTVTANGWQLWDGRVIARSNVKLSPDRRYHLCETSTKAIICFFAPPGGS